MLLEVPHNILNVDLEIVISDLENPPLRIFFAIRQKKPQI